MPKEKMEKGQYVKHALKLKITNTLKKHISLKELKQSEKPPKNDIWDG